tara:strand:+ start:18 stop:227 length:210 start_codon:yes stop_codon:yes gene_type:complete
MLKRFGYRHISVFTQVTLYLFVHKNHRLFKLVGKENYALSVTPGKIRLQKFHYYLVVIHVTSVLSKQVS